MPMLFGGLFGATCPVQSGLKRNFPSGWRETVEEMRGLEIGLQVDPTCSSLNDCEVAQPALAEHDVDMLLLGQAEARHVGDAEPLGQFLDDEMVGARPFRRLDQLRARA